MLFSNNQRPVRITRLAIIFAVLILGWGRDAVSELQRQFIAELWPPVSAEDHIFDLVRLNYEAVPGLDFLKGCLDVLFINSSATIIN